MLRLDLLREHCILMFGQWKYIIMYGSTIGSLTFSLNYLPLKYGQGKGLNQCQKLLAIVMFGVVQHMF